jgi:hypothetical protein
MATPREKRLLLIGGVCAVVFTAIGFWPESKAPTVVASSSIPQAEKRLARLRQLAGAVPGRLDTEQKATEELAKREKGLIQADTAAQAQAQMMQVIRRIGKQQQPPLDFRGVEWTPPKPYGEFYGEVAATVQVNCRIEQFVNLLADLEKQPELIAIREWQVGAADGKEKLIPARMTFSGLVSRKLIPKAGREMGAF